MIITGSLETCQLDTIRDYICNLDIPTGKTFHEFEKNLPPFVFGSVKNGVPLDLIRKRFPNHEIVIVDEMNEVYVSSIGSNGSDMVFETPHIDGPFGFVPGTILFRCLVVVQGNSSVSTHFPHDDKVFNLDTRDILMFDYNRDVHYIRHDGSSSDTRRRVLLKIHYAVVPRVASSIFARMNSLYNTLARQNFVRTQDPKTIFAKFNSFFINTITKIYVQWFHTFSHFASQHPTHHGLPHAGI